MSRDAEVERDFEGTFDAWVALWACPGTERRVAEALEEEGFPVYVPMRRRLSHGKLVGRRAVIAGYLFARAKVLGPEGWRRVLAVEGVSGVVFCGPKVAAISDAEIERLQGSQVDTARQELLWWLAEHGHIRGRHIVKIKRTRSQRRKQRKAKAKARKEAIEIREAA